MRKLPSLRVKAQLSALTVIQFLAVTGEAPPSLKTGATGCLVKYQQSLDYW